MLARGDGIESFKPTELFEEEGWISAVTFSSDACVFVGGRRGRVGRSHIAKFSDGKLANVLTRRHEEWVRQVAISGDHQLLALQEDFSSGLIHVYLLKSLGNEPVFKVSGHAHRTVAVAFSPDSTQLITGGDDGTARFWDTESGELVGTLDASERVRFIGFIPQSPDMVTASPEGWLRFWKRGPAFAP